MMDVFRSRTELVETLNRYRENIRWYVEERNRLIEELEARTASAGFTVIEDMGKIVTQIVHVSTAKLPALTRESEAAVLRASLEKAYKVMSDAGEDEGWIELCLRRMGQQFYPFQGPESRRK